MRERPQNNPDREGKDSDLNSLAPGLRRAFDLLSETEERAREAGVITVRKVAWRLIKENAAVWEALSAPGAPSSMEGLRASSSEIPTIAELQGWLDGIHAALHNNPEHPGKFGSFEAGLKFVAAIRGILQVMDLQILDPKTGEPGTLFIRKAGNSACGQFVIQLTRKREGTRIGFTSTKFPRLIITEKN